MECQIDLNPEIRNIESFKILLKRYRDYQSCIRDIKINTVLGQKCLFEIEDINPPIWCDFSQNSMTSILDSAVSIKKISFKIDDNMNVTSLTLTYDVLATRMGKLINELINIGIQIQLHPKVISGSWQVIGFYIMNENLTTD